MDSTLDYKRQVFFDILKRSAFTDIKFYRCPYSYSSFYLVDVKNEVPVFVIHDDEIIINGNSVPNIFKSFNFEKLKERKAIDFLERFIWSTIRQKIKEAGVNDDKIVKKVERTKVITKKEHAGSYNEFKNIVLQRTIYYNGTKYVFLNKLKKLVDIIKNILKWKKNK